MKEIVEPLLSWYLAAARPLPWRKAPKAYTTWVSEIMLQQTRVDTVIPYYERFIRELPDVAALASCPQEKLLKLWEGLGYYSRVRNMKEAAGQVMGIYHGRFPDNYQQLRTLKGIGDYTAGAIASIVFGEAVPAVDGNVLRVTARLTADPSDIMKQAVRRKMADALKKIIPPEAPGAFNQALMELGALICTPSGVPACGACPVSFFCKARQINCQDQFPIHAPKKGRKQEKRTILILQDPAGKIALSKRPSKGLLAGLYEPVNLEGKLSEAEVRALIEDLGLRLLRLIRLPESKHIFSHIEWHMNGYRAMVEVPEGAQTGQLVFIRPEEIGQRCPVPSAFNAYMADADNDD